MGLIFLGTVDAASDATMATVTNRTNSLFRAALRSLIEAVLSQNSTVIAAAQAAAAAAVEDAIDSQFPGAVEESIRTVGGGRLSDTGALVSSGATYTDLNTLPAMSGWYRVSSTALNRPLTVGVQFSVLHLPINETNAAQIAMPVSGVLGPVPESIFFRSKRSDVWGPWQRAATDADLAAVAANLRADFIAADQAIMAALAAADDDVRDEFAAEDTAIRAELVAGDNAVRAELVAGDNAVRAEVDQDPRLVRKAERTGWASGDARRRDYLGWWEDSGVAFAPMGMETPFAGEAVPSEHVGVISGTFDPVRRRYYQDAIGPDGRFLPSTFDDIAAEVGSRLGGGGAVGGVKNAPLALTCAAGGTVIDTASARTVRYPVKVPVGVSRFRVHIANRNDRQATLYPGELSMTGLWWGEAARVAGELNGATVSVPQQLRGAFTTPANGGEWVSEWFATSIPGGVDHILSLGYTAAAGQTNHAGQGGAWVSTTPADASATAPVVSRVQQAPLDVWLECEIPANVPVIACLGDSLTAGTAATLPVHDSWPAIYGALQGVWPAHFAHHGSAMTDWTAGDTWRWTKYGATVFDAVIWALGSNDIFGGADLPTAKARFEALHPKVAALSPRIILATVMPRNGTAAPVEAVRVAYNAWLWQRPLNAVGVVDFAKSIESAIGTVRADYIAGDGTHLLTAGYAQNALAIPGRLVH